MQPLPRLAIAFTTHQPNHAVAIADKVLLMLGLARAAFGAIDDVMTEENLEALYGLPVRSATLGSSELVETAFVPLFRQRDRKGNRP